MATRPLGERGNRLGDAGAVHIAELVAKNRALRRIDLRSNQITSRGAFPISSALESNYTLVELGLARFVARSIRRRIRARLAENAQRSPWPRVTPPYVAAIRSVYRTLPPNSSPDGRRFGRAAVIRACFAGARCTP